MNTSTAGLLLLVIALLALSGFLTGNLDRWVAYLFDPTRPGLVPKGSPSPAISRPPAGSSPLPANAASALVSLGQTSSRQSA